MKNFTKGQLAMLAASSGLEPCESLYSMATFKKAQTIFEFVPLLSDGVIEGRHQFEAVYREALYRKKIAKKMDSMKARQPTADKYCTPTGRPRHKPSSTF
jgi:hypothetical protein